MLAIRPYPIKYISPWKTRDGVDIVIRPIKPEDEPLLVKFHQTLSDRSVYMRFLNPMLLGQRIAHERLTRVAFNDYDREMALVAQCEDCDGEPEIMGVARLSKLHGRPEGRFTMLISDLHQGRGIGSELLKRIIQVGRDEKLEIISAVMSVENTEMHRMLERLGFVITPLDDKLLRAEIKL
jgi:acetyltransferase